MQTVQRHFPPRPLPSKMQEIGSQRSASASWLAPLSAAGVRSIITIIRARLHINLASHAWPLVKLLTSTICTPAGAICSLVDGNGMLGMPCDPDQNVNASAGSEFTEEKPFDIEHSSRPCGIPGTIRLADAKDYASLQLTWRKHVPWTLLPLEPQACGNLWFCVCPLLGMSRWCLTRPSYDMGCAGPTEAQEWQAQ